MARIIHQVGHCMDCELFWDDHRNARKKAAAHSKATGHRVFGESAITWEYGKRKQ